MFVYAAGPLLPWSSLLTTAPVILRLTRFNRFNYNFRFVFDLKLSFTICILRLSWKSLMKYHDFLNFFKFNRILFKVEISKAMGSCFSLINQTPPLLASSGNMFKRTEHRNIWPCTVNYTAVCVIMSNLFLFHKVSRIWWFYVCGKRVSISTQMIMLDSFP